MLILNPCRQFNYLAIDISCFNSLHRHGRMFIRPIPSENLFHSFPLPSFSPSLSLPFSFSHPHPLPLSPRPDINECSEGTHNCDQTCYNTPGAFICVCRNGYKLLTNGRTCKGSHSLRNYLILFPSMSI